MVPPTERQVDTGRDVEGSHGAWRALKKIDDLSGPKSPIPGWCFAHVKHIAEQIQRSPRTMKRYLATLRQAGKIEVRTVFDLIDAGELDEKYRRWGDKRLIRPSARSAKGVKSDTGGVTELTPGGCQECHGGGDKTVTPSAAPHDEVLVLDGNSENEPQINISSQAAGAEVVKGEEEEQDPESDASEDRPFVPPLLEPGPWMTTKGMVFALTERGLSEGLAIRLINQEQPDPPFFLAVLELYDEKHKAGELDNPPGALRSMFTDPESWGLEEIEEGIWQSIEMVLAEREEEQRLAKVQKARAAAKAAKEAREAEEAEARMNPPTKEQLERLAQAWKVPPKNPRPPSPRPSQAPPKYQSPRPEQSAEEFMRERGFDMFRPGNPAKQEQAEVKPGEAAT